MATASDSFRTVTVKIHDISQQLPYIVVNQADDNGKIIRFVPLDHGQKVTGFTGARLYYPPRSDDEYGDYVTGVESDGAWDFTIPVGVLRAGRVGCNLAFIDGDGETYSRNVVFLVEPAVSGVFDPEDGQQTRLDKIIGTVQDAADTAIDSINNTVDDAMESIGKAEESISESVEDARGSAEAAANSAQQAAVSASAAQTSERNAANSATQASQSATAAKASETAAKASADSATQSASAAAVSAESAQTATESAASSKDAAAQSASEASASASAAKASETNAASSASAAKVSETNAAASATEAQQAVDGFGLEVGTTTTGDPGTDAAVSIAKQGTKYTANFTIPRGDKGADGVNENVPTRTVSGLIAHADDAYPVAPREIRIHGGQFSSLNLLGKNFAVVTSFTSSTGNTATVNDDGSITVKAVTTNTSDYLFLKRVGKILVPGVEFTVSLTDKSGAPVSGIVGLLSVFGYSGSIDIASTDAVNHGVVPDDYISDRFQIQIPPNVSFNGTVFMQIEYGDKATSWEKPIVHAARVNAELAQDDTLVISEDGSCRVERASGEPTQLDPIELPVLPAPTFNVYTDSIVSPTVDVTYEQDVNLVLQALEAKIASFEVTQTIMKGA